MMFLFARNLYASVLAALQIIQCPFRIVCGFIYKPLRGWKPQKSDAEGLHGSSLRRNTVTSAAPANDLLTHPGHVEVIEVRRYYPPGVSKIIIRGGDNFIGLIDESTVLKYPCVPGNRESIEIEAQLLTVLGSHPRILASKGLNEHGLVLQYAPNGTLYKYITSERAIPLDQKLHWCKQAAKAVKYIHGKHVIHYNINLHNFLLNDNLSLLLADFQGMLKSAHSKTLLDGLSREYLKSFMPQVHGDYADIKTDIFALGSAIYFIMVRHEVFPELDSLEDDEQIESRFRNGHFPTDDHICSKITEKCWWQLYESADEVVVDISQVQASKEATGEALRIVECDK